MSFSMSNIFGSFDSAGLSAAFSPPPMASAWSQLLQQQASAAAAASSSSSSSAAESGEETASEEPRVPATLYRHYSLPAAFLAFLETLGVANNEHPIPLVETETLASIPLPPLSGYERLADTVPSGLSGPQLLSVLYADKAHRRWLPAGRAPPAELSGSSAAHTGWLAQNAVREQRERCGFWIADGTGVGKGRQCAGILVSNMLKRRYLHVWFSPSRCLINDLRRDLVNIGAAKVVVLDLRAVKSFATIKPHLVAAVRRSLRMRTGRAPLEPNGVVLFVTYSLMSQDKRAGLLTELLQRYAHWERKQAKLLVHADPYSSPVFSFSSQQDKHSDHDDDDDDDDDDDQNKEPAAADDDLLLFPELDNCSQDQVGADSQQAIPCSQQAIPCSQQAIPRSQQVILDDSTDSVISSSSSQVDVDDVKKEEGSRRKTIGSVFDEELQRDIEERVGYSGVIVFDESHKAKGLGIKGPATKIATRIRALQEEHNGARVVYASATGAVTLSDMAYLTRLGLWGPGSSFPTFGSFSRALSRKGQNSTSMELACMELKRSGVMCTRTLGFHDTEFSIDSVQLSAGDLATYNDCVELWEQIVAVWPRTDSASASAATLQRYLWAAHQRFFLQLLLAMKIPSAAELAKAEVAAGRAVIISLISTGGSYTQGLGGDDDDESEDPLLDTVFQSALKEIVSNTLGYIGAHFPELPLAPIAQRLAGINLEINSLDLLIDLLGGPAHVSEVTGRSVRTVRVDGQLRRVNRGNNETQRETRRFMAGKTKVVVITSAGSHGISLHSDRSCANQCKRVHMMLQLPWSATVALQQFGRSHRSNQVTPPVYRLIVTPLGGEYRLASTIANQLCELGAVTSADRRATAHLSPIEQQYALLPLYADKAASLLCKAVAAAATARPAVGVDAMPGSSHDMFSELLATGSIAELSAGSKQHSLAAVYTAKSFSQFLNRILGLRVADQERIFRHFMQAYYDVVHRAKQDGSFDPGISQLNGVADGEEVWYQEGSDRTVCTTLLRDRGVSWPRADKMLQHHTNAEADVRNGFYLSQANHVALLLKRPLTSADRALRKQGLHVLRQFSALRPNGGPVEIVAENQFYRWSPLEPAKARPLWEQGYRTSNNQTPTGRIQKSFVMSGLLLPIFAEIQSAAGSRRIGVCRVRYLDSLDQQAAADNDDENGAGNNEDDEQLLLSGTDEEFYRRAPPPQPQKQQRSGRTHCGLLLPTVDIANAVRRMLHARQAKQAEELLLAEQSSSSSSSSSSSHFKTAGGKQPAINLAALLAAQRSLDAQLQHTGLLPMPTAPPPLFQYDARSLIDNAVPQFSFGPPPPCLRPPGEIAQLSPCTSCHAPYPIKQFSCPKCFAPRIAAAPTYRSHPLRRDAAPPARFTVSSSQPDVLEVLDSDDDKQPIIILDDDDDDDVVTASNGRTKRSEHHIVSLSSPEPSPKRHTSMQHSLSDVFE